jgi:hypothetical protein
MNTYNYSTTMEMLIEDSLELREIQGIFNSHFPNLRLGFFNTNVGARDLFSGKNMLNTFGMNVGEITRLHYAGYLRINSFQKVGEIERLFMVVFGLPARIFMKTGEQWLATGGSAKQTLAEQNRKGMGNLHALYKEV